VSIEATYKTWKLVLKLLLATFVLYSAWIAVPNIVDSFRIRILAKSTSTFLENTAPGYAILGLVVIGLLLLAVFLWSAYRIWLSRNPELRAAANDELVRANWLKSFRFSYLCVLGTLIVNAAIGFTMGMIRHDMRPTWWGEFWIGLLPQVYVPIAGAALIGSFLFFDRDRKND
jgi:hypothetical protein